MAYQTLWEKDLNSDEQRLGACEALVILAIATEFRAVLMQSIIGEPLFTAIHWLAALGEEFLVTITALAIIAMPRLNLCEEPIVCIYDRFVW